MKRQLISLFISLSFCLILFFTAQTAAVEAASAQPNIVFLFADDLGYGDIACYGAPDARTPHLDRLAKQGVRLTQHYSNGPECSPTRTALLTGRYQQRAGGLECAIGTGNVGRYDDAIRLAKGNQLGLPVQQAVLPRAIKEAGYATACLASGTWAMNRNLIHCDTASIAFLAAWVAMSITLLTLSFRRCRFSIKTTGPFRATDI